MQDKIRVRRMINKETKFSHNDKTSNNMETIWKQK